MAPRGAAEAPSQVASPTQSAALTAFPTEAEIVERKRTPPSLETVLAVARNLGIDADWARAFHADMTADGWCYINASGNTAMVNVINFGSVMRKRFQWAKEDRRDRQGGVSDEINEAARKIRIERDARLRALHEKEARAARKGGEA